MVLMIVIWIWESLDGLITRKAGAAGHRSIQCPQLWPSQQWSHSLTLQLTIAAARHHGALQILPQKTPVNFGQPCLRQLTRRGKHWKMTNRSRFSSAAGCCLSCRIFLHSFKDLPELQIFLPVSVITWPPKCLVCQIFLSPLTNIFISAPRDSFRHFLTPPQDSLELCIIMLISRSRFLLFVLTMARPGSFISPRGERRNFHSIIWSMYYLVISINQ